MSEYFRQRKDVNDTRPIPITGPKSFSYRWKMVALLEINEDGQYVLPFSRRMVNVSTLLWPRSHKQPPPHGYELCGCLHCENKTWADHLIKDDPDDEVSAYGNLHLELVQPKVDMDSEAGPDELPLSSTVVTAAVPDSSDTEEEEEEEEEGEDEEDDEEEVEESEAEDESEEHEESEEDDIDDYDMDTSDHSYIPSS